MYNSNNSSINNSSSNNSCNNSCNNDLFFKVFRNIYLKDLVLSFIKRQAKVGYDYNGTTSLKKMVENKKFEMIQDKLQSNHYICIDLSLNKLFQELSASSSSSTNRIETIFTPIINKYYSIVQSISPIEESIRYKSLDSFKYFIHHFNINPHINNNNSKNNNTYINQSYRLYHLLEESLIHGSIKIAKYILDLIKSSSNINGTGIDNGSGSRSSGSRISGSRSSGSRISGSSIGGSISGDKESIINQIMIFNPNNFERYFYILINELDKEKYEFIRDGLELDLESLISCQESNDIKNSFYINSNLNYPNIDYLLLLNGFKVNFGFSVAENVDGDIIYAKIKLLTPERMHNSGDKIRINQFIQFLVSNPNLKKLKLLISGVREILSRELNCKENFIKLEDSLLGVFGSFLIYHYLKTKEYDRIISLFKYSSFDQKTNIFITTRDYSISKLSTSAYRLLVQLLSIGEDIGWDSYEKHIKFSNGIVDNEKAIKYINFLMDQFSTSINNNNNSNNNNSNSNNNSNNSNSNHSNSNHISNSLEIKIISKLVEKLINQYDFEFIQLVYNQNERFRGYYSRVVSNSDIYFNVDRVINKRKISLANGNGSSDDGDGNDGGIYNSSLELSITDEDLDELFTRTIISDVNGYQYGYNSGNQLITLKYKIGDIIKDDDEKDSASEENQIDEYDDKYQQLEDQGYSGIKELYNSLKTHRYNKALEMVSNMDKEFSGVLCVMDFFDHSISLDWFEKLYVSIFKPILDYGYYYSRFELVTSITYCRRDIFEYLWSNWFNFQFKKDLVFYLLTLVYKIEYGSISMEIIQLLVYTLRAKRDFINDQFIVDNKFIFNQDGSNVEESELSFEDCYINILYNSGNIELFQVFEQSFPSYKFKLNSRILEMFIHDHRAVINHHSLLEFLYYNGNIDNLGDIVNQVDQFNNYDNFTKKNYDCNVYFISSSLLIILKQLLIKSKES